MRRGFDEFGVSPAASCLDHGPRLRRFTRLRDRPRDDEQSRYRVVRRPSRQCLTRDPLGTGPEPAGSFAAAETALPPAFSRGLCWINGRRRNRRRAGCMRGDRRHRLGRHRLGHRLNDTPRWRVGFRLIWRRLHMHGLDDRIASVGVAIVVALHRRHRGCHRFRRIWHARPRRRLAAFGGAPPSRLLGARPRHATRTPFILRSMAAIDLG